MLGSQTCSCCSVTGKWAETEAAILSEANLGPVRDNGTWDYCGPPVLSATFFFIAYDEEVISQVGHSDSL